MASSGRRKTPGHLWAAMGLVVVGIVVLVPGCYFPDDVKAFLQKDRKPVNGVEYRFYPPDSLSISSFNVPEINGAGGRIRPDGKINLPLLGEVFVAGKTPAEIEKLLIEASKEYYERADATVQVGAYASQFYYIFGQVSSPGPKVWTGRDTLLDALSRSFPNNLAWAERITVTRPSKPHVGGYYQEAPKVFGRFRRCGIHVPEEDNEPTIMLFNLEAMTRNGDMSHNILLMPNDIIYVQPTPLAWIGLTIQRLLFPVSPVTSAMGVPYQLDRAATERYDQSRGR